MGGGFFYSLLQEDHSTSDGGSEQDKGRFHAGWTDGWDLYWDRLINAVTLRWFRHWLL